MELDIRQLINQHIHREDNLNQMKNIIKDVNHF